MKMSQIFAPTLREIPSDAEIPSHQLMLRAGMMKKALSGIYTYLPLGYRVIKKVENIIREEMDRQDGQEVLMPALQSADLWKETGRWEAYGSEMFRLTDRGSRDLCLGPTHEELVTSTIRDDIRSYRQLPKMIYQIQTKFRDEIRPRFGLMRAREFIMKDMYSFDRDEANLDISYRKMYEAYCRTFDRCGLEYKVVEADCGTIGGTSSHEYMVISDIGEAAIVYCDKCSYGANVERAEVQYAPCDKKGDVSTLPQVEKVSTPDVKTIEDLAEFFNCKPEKMLKTLIYVADGKPVAVVIRGDRALNEVKLANCLGAKEIELASEEVIYQVTKAPVGFAGPVGLSGVKVIGDFEIQDISCGITGANERDMHIKNVVYGRDYEVSMLADLRDVVENDPCPNCKNPLSVARGIEVGHLFKLGTKYSKVLGASYLNEEGVDNPIVMGCYGIGVTRVVAAVIETCHDKDGIVWPMSIAPFHVNLLVVNTTDDNQVKVAQEVYQKLQDAGIEVLIDDRDERPGVKFKDADLIGIPIRVTVGRTVEEGAVEVKLRNSSEVEKVAVDSVVDKVKEIIASQMQKLQPRGMKMN